MARSPSGLPSRIAHGALHTVLAKKPECTSESQTAVRGVRKTLPGTLIHVLSDVLGCDGSCLGVSHPWYQTVGGGCVCRWKLWQVWRCRVPGGVGPGETGQTEATAGAERPHIPEWVPVLSQDLAVLLSEVFLQVWAGGIGSHWGPVSHPGLCAQLTPTHACALIPWQLLLLLPPNRSPPCAHSGRILGPVLPSAQRRGASQSISPTPAAVPYETLHS